MLRVVGAGVGRTGTHSLKLALEQLLGAPCYHMTELFPRPQHVALWHDAICDRPVDWDAVLGDFAATVDWPGAAVWDQIHAAYPDAVVLLSTRDSAEQWWDSFSQTILQVMLKSAGGEPDAWSSMARDMLERFCPAGVADQHAAMAAYDAHNARVRSMVPADRLIEWQPRDGWGPICEGLGLPVPEVPFPHVNTTEEFRSMTGLGT